VKVKGDTKMGYYMRYLFEGQPVVRLEDIETALKKVDEDYVLTYWEDDHSHAEITYQGQVYGVMGLEFLTEDGLDEEIEEMVEKVELVKGLFVKKPKERVLEFLKQVKVRVIVQVLDGGRTIEQTFSKIDPVWEWLMANYKGLLHADGEGFYEGKKLILKVR
jgi:hypothetical protein